MSFRLFLTSFALLSGLSFLPFQISAETQPSNNYKVLSGGGTGLNINTVRSYIDLADEAINRGDLARGIELLKKARQVSNLLTSYYRDINGSFRGLDALIPREMNKKNLETISLLAKSNLRLAAIHRKRNEPELAVPLLVDVLKFMTPSRPEGSQAYNALLELGFVETPYAGARKALE